MLLHASNNILVKKLFGNDLVGRFSYISLTIQQKCLKKWIGSSAMNTIIQLYYYAVHRMIRIWEP